MSLHVVCSKSYNVLDARPGRVNIMIVFGILVDCGQ